MKVGIIGYAQSGKSTLYRAAAQGQAKGDVTAVPVPDPRFDAIVAKIQPKKTTPATVILHDDIEPIGSGRPMFSNRFLEQARKADVLLHVVRAFESHSAPYHQDVSPARDQEAVDVEMVLSDLATIENRYEKLLKIQATKSPGSTEYNEKMLFERMRPDLEDGKPIRALGLSEEELKICGNFQFLSAKQTVVAFNADEDEAASPSDAVKRKIEELAEQGTKAFSVCASIEEEVAQLDPEDQPEFLKDLGLTQPASVVMVKAVYDALGLITFLTVAEKETRAWPLRRGSTALKAASTIHTDIAKGFIRAEVVSYADWEQYGSQDEANKAGKMRLEGKEYAIQDGDLLNIRNKS